MLIGNPDGAVFATFPKPTEVEVNPDTEPVNITLPKSSKEDTAVIPPFKITKPPVIVVFFIIDIELTFKFIKLLLLISNTDRPLIPPVTFNKFEELVIPGVNIPLIKDGDVSFAKVGSCDVNVALM